MFSNGTIYDTLNWGYNYNLGNIYDSFINTIHQLKEIICINIENIIIHKDEPSLEEFIKNIKDSLKTTENILLNLDFFKEEYYDLSSITNMIFYILDNKSTYNNLSILKNLFNSFYNLIKLKKDCYEEEYEIKYNKFTSQLIDTEQIFYNKIYQPSKNYDEKVLTKISNSLWD